MGERWDRFVDALSDFFQWLGSEKTRQAVEGVLRLVVLVAEIVERFNTPLTGREKRELVRLMIRFGKYSTMDQMAEFVRAMAELKAGGDLDGLEAWEIDKLVGDGVALFMAEQLAGGGQGGAPEALEY